ncbi:MAG: PPOX class F420-dependent enzyme [Rhodospirillaceae bacterium]|nr:PPOX class F420-dependent enzyme [Rhodospirillaceae bacterium]|tara:strand:- start:108 stop:491 length:384 start_codon:yes stop_codon:yes gene_type:complete
MISKKEKYINLSTRKRNGTYVNTPVWFAQEKESNIYYIYTLKKSGKVKRIRNFPDVKITPCNFSGKVKGNWISAKAELIEDKDKIKLAYSLLRFKYGIYFKIGDFFSWVVGNYNKRQIIKFCIMPSK